MWQDLCVYNTDYDGLGPGFLERPGSPGGSGEGGGHIPVRMAGLPPGGPVTQPRNQDRPPRSGI